MPDVPRWALKWLEWTIPSTERGDAVLGDLLEEYFGRAVSSGDDPATAERAARRWFVREARTVGWRYLLERLRRAAPGSDWNGRRRDTRAGRTALLTGFFHDVRHAFRSLIRSRAYTAMAIITLALGIGISALAFTVIDSLTFRPLPVEDADRLVALYGARGDERLLRYSYQDWIDYRQATQDVFHDVAASSAWPGSFAEGGGQGQMVWTELVTDNWFTVVRPGAAVGRLLIAGDEDAVVLSHRFWQRRFGGDPDVVGRRVSINGQPLTVVGVAAGHFVGTRLLAFAPDVWVPVGAWDRVQPAVRGSLTDRARMPLMLHARLRPGVTAERARVLMDAVARSLGAAFPETHADRTTLVVENERPENAAEMGVSPARARFAGLVALAGVGLILLIACVNVANLQLARGMGRRRDVAVRLSLGASRGRVIRQWIAESMLVSLAGGALGIALAAFLARFELLGNPGLEFEVALRPSVEWRVVLFTFVVAAAAGLVAGLWPALRESRADPATSLRRGSGGAARSTPVMGFLVVAQVAVSVVVLMVAGLLFQSAQQQQAISPGFPLERGVVVTIDPGLNGYTPEQSRVYFDRLVEELRALPGVSNAARATNLPLGGNFVRTQIATDAAARVSDGLRVATYSAGPGWLEALGTPVLEGRDFAAGDTAGAPGIVIVNQALARRLFPDGSAVGRQLHFGTSPMAEIVGIVADTKLEALTEEPQPLLIRSIAQSASGRSLILVRTTGESAAVTSAVSRTLAGLDPTIAVIGPRSLRDATRAALAAGTSGARASSIFGALALLLSVAGLYGVVWYGVTRKRREIGIRMALGAGTGRVASSVVRSGLRLVAAGFVLGALLSLAMSGLMRSMVFGVSPTDPVTLLLVGAVILAVGALASWIPARRASRVDPIQVLRAD
jgi:predicted permease